MSSGGSSSASSFSRCPSYVPRVAHDGVRVLLEAFATGGAPSFAEFKRCWSASALPTLLASALKPQRDRASATTTSPSQLYAAAAAFLPGTVAGARGLDRRLVQIGALFTLFCVYFGQPDNMHKR